MENRGIIYVATGRQFVEEALISARSVKMHMPEISITLYTDIKELWNMPPEQINVTFPLKRVTRSCLDKMYPLVSTPYEKTLFLDTDTYVCKRLDDIFEVLNHYDIAAAHPPNRIQYRLPDCPECFPELNTGVIAFRRSQQALDVLKRWPDEYERQLASDRKPRHDQHSFRAVLYRSSARFLVLPHEYNFRTIGPNFAGRGCYVKIIHGRHANFERLATRLNLTTDYRVFLINPFRILTKELITYESIVETLMNRIFQSLPFGLRQLLSSVRSKVTG